MRYQLIQQREAVHHKNPQEHAGYLQHHMSEPRLFMELRNQIGTRYVEEIASGKGEELRFQTLESSGTCQEKNGTKQC